MLWVKETNVFVFQSWAPPVQCINEAAFCALQDLPQGYVSHEKTVAIKKEPKESLGITIGGGRDNKNKLPIYVTSVQPIGCLFRDGRIKRGKGGSQTLYPLGTVGYFQWELDWTLKRGWKQGYHDP